jgi:trehalose/maltose transport system substrate-binding protein
MKSTILNYFGLPLILFSLFLFLPTVPASAGVRIRIAADSDVGLAGRWAKARAEEWATKTGNEIEYQSLPSSANEVLTLFSQYWASQSPDIDIYEIDVTWPGIEAPHAIDLKKYFTEDAVRQFFPRIIENNTVEGRLIGIPFFTDAGSSTIARISWKSTDTKNLPKPGKSSGR